MIIDIKYIDFILDEEFIRIIIGLLLMLYFISTNINQYLITINIV